MSPLGLVSLAMGLGAFLVADALFWPGQPAKARLRPVGMRSRKRENRYRLRVADFVRGIGMAAAAGVVANIVSGIPALAVLAAGAGATTPIVIARRSARKKSDEKRRAWPVAIEGIVAGVRSGESLAQSVVDLAHTGPPALQSDFARFAASYRRSGSLGKALHELKDESLPDPLTDRIVVALGMAHELGGRELTRLLRSLAEFTREAIATEAEVRARQAWTVTAARAAAAAPWLILFLFSSKEAGSAAFSSPGGTVLIAVGFVTTSVGYLTMLAIGKPRRTRTI